MTKAMQATRYIVEYGKTHPAHPDDKRCGVFRIEGTIAFDGGWNENRFYEPINADGVVTNHPLNSIYEDRDAAYAEYERVSKALIDEFNHRITRLELAAMRK